MIVGASDSDTDFDLDDTGGAKTHTHTLGDGYAQIHITSSNPMVMGVRKTGQPQYNTNYGVNASSGGASTNNIGSGIQLAGSTDSASNLPPFIAKYIWQRVS